MFFSIVITPYTEHISPTVTFNGFPGVPVQQLSTGQKRLLHVLSDVWRATNSLHCFDPPKRLYIYINKPETELHPSDQVRLLKAINYLRIVFSSIDTNVCFIIESHSEHFINKLGDMIDNSKFCKCDVIILLFKSDGNVRNLRLIVKGY